MSKIIIGPQSGLKWIPLSTSEIPCPDTKATVHAVRKWVEEYLTAPSSDLGRDGPVCPYSGPSMRKDLMWVGRIPGAKPWPDFVRLVVDDALNALLTLEPVEGNASLLRVLMTTLPDLRDYDLIDELHAELKTKFVERGAMLGQFYPGCGQPGLWNDNFHPLDAPIPMLVVRTMMTSDFPFLVGRPEWMSAYIKKFAPTLPAHIRREVVGRLTVDATHDAQIASEPMPAGRHTFG
ncbi:DUF6875 domain-containing protein [Nocardia australiensis]|uniref:DUF6875 domain-containing protein n=1 Tax=Nocardia australiensis TaxID=2887191 RepID=UPI001D136FBF|nr:hypothetical protein [Nocardia australiensis]